MKRLAVSIFLALLAAVSMYAADLQILADDLRLVYEEGRGFEDVSGYHLYIRKKDGIGSVMLLETTRDPEGQADSFAYRAREYNSINGDEIRYLNGKTLVSEYARYSLIDSTVEADEQFGEAFHIYIPAELVYGYPWERNGTVQIGRGTFINIRAFEKPYGDYTGGYSDNPFMFDLKAPVKKELPPAPSPEPAPEPEPEKEETIILTDDYNPLAVVSFQDIAGFSGGKMVFSRGPDSIVDDAMDALGRIPKAEQIDVVFAIDATGSMIDDIEKLRNEWIPRLADALKEYADIRIGLLLYRDYKNVYDRKLPVEPFDFTEDIDQFNKHLNSFTIRKDDGGDTPEAVYEALWASMDMYKWRLQAYRKIILIGDAEPHPSPRGSRKYSKELVARTASEKEIVIDTIIVPDDKARRGR